MICFGMKRLISLSMTEVESYVCFFLVAEDVKRCRLVMQPSIYVLFKVKALGLGGQHIRLLFSN